MDSTSLGNSARWTFHLADGVGVGERGERGGISREQPALRRLAEREACEQRPVSH